MKNWKTILIFVVILLAIIGAYVVYTVALWTLKLIAVAAFIFCCYKIYSFFQRTKGVPRK